MFKGLSVFQQVGYRSDGRTFFVEWWDGSSQAIVSYRDGSRERLALVDEELRSIYLAPLAGEAQMTAALDDALRAARVVPTVYPLHRRAA